MYKIIFNISCGHLSDNDYYLTLKLCKITYIHFKHIHTDQTHIINKRFQYSYHKVYFYLQNTNFWDTVLQKITLKLYRMYFFSIFFTVMYKLNRMLHYGTSMSQIVCSPSLLTEVYTL